MTEAVWKRHWFLLEELVRRDFTQKYKRTFLGVAWSLLSPLCSLFVMYFVFGTFFSHSLPSYLTYLFAGQIVFSFFSEGTRGGMGSVLGNSVVLSKINIPKYIFLLSQNIKALIAFGINLAVFLAVAALCGHGLHLRYLALLYHTVCLLALNIGVSLLLATVFVFFRDAMYLYGIFTQLLSNLSAIFYTTSAFPEKVRWVFYLNPVYIYITYFRQVVIGGSIPPLSLHALALGYPLLALAVGGLVFRRFQDRFIYYY